MEPWLLSGLIAGAFALGGVWLGDRLRSEAAVKQARLATIQRHNDQAAEAIAQLLITTDKMQPDSFIWEPEHGASRKRIASIIDELQAQQMGLTTVSVGHPIKEIRDGMAQIRKLAFTVYLDTSAFVATFSGLEEGVVAGDISGKRDKAIASWMALRDVTQLLVDKMHEEAAPPRLIRSVRWRLQLRWQARHRYEVAIGSKPPAVLRHPY